jgi:uncharacterized ferritin-like protein (DUF455 family)
VNRVGKFLERIIDVGIRHIGFGAKHFREACLRRDEAPHEMWQNLGERHFRGPQQPPFNDSARLAGGLPRDRYAAIA